MRRILFICGQNRLRSPTAEQLFAGRPGIEVASAGLKRESDTPVSRDLIEWADLIFVMERSHRAKLTQRFKPLLKEKRIVCLNIPDRFEFMDRELIEMLEARVAPHLPRS